MSIGTDVARIKGNITAALAAIADKGVIVPDGSTSDALSGLIASIEVGGSSGSIRIDQGSVTFAATTNSYKFVEDTTDIFIAYVETDTDPVYSSSNFIWAIIQDTRIFDYYGKKRETAFLFGYNRGSYKYYVPLKVASSTRGIFNNNMVNSSLGATTYKWYAIYGVTAT